MKGIIQDPGPPNFLPKLSSSFLEGKVSLFSDAYTKFFDKGPCNFGTSFVNFDLIIVPNVSFNSPKYNFFCPLSLKFTKVLLLSLINCSLSVP